MNVLSIDYDYWYEGESFIHRTEGWVDLHCGRCGDFSRFPCRPLRRAIAASAPPCLNEEAVIERAGGPLYVSECHADLAKLLINRGSKEYTVFHIDAHEDNAYFTPWGLTCGTWISYLQDCKGVFCTIYRVHYPENLSVIDDVDLTYVCKSSPYLLRQASKKFRLFVLALEKRLGRRARVFGYDRERIKRELREERAVQ